jgi:Cyclin, N-terminal domain
MCHHNLKDRGFFGLGFTQKTKKRYHIIVNPRIFSSAKSKYTNRIIYLPTMIDTTIVQPPPQEHPSREALLVRRQHGKKVRTTHPTCDSYTSNNQDTNVLDHRRRRSDNDDVVDEHIQVLLRQEQIYQRRMVDYMAHERVQDDNASLFHCDTANLFQQCKSSSHRSSCNSSMMDIYTDDQQIQSSSSSCSSCSSVSMNKVHSAVSMSDVKDVASIDEQQQLSRSKDWMIRQEVPLKKIPTQTFTFWRQQMFDWACMVVDSYGIERELVANSFNLLDRYISYECSKLDGPPITREDYQLFCMTCLYLAVKIEESYNKKLSVQTLVVMSKNYYTKEVIEATECDILRALDWCVHAPTSMSYVRLLAQLFSKPISYQMQAMARTFTEMAVVDSFLCTQKPSYIGVASILHAARIDGMSDSEIQLFRKNIPDILSPRADCPEFRRIYLQLAKLYYN